MPPHSGFHWITTLRPERNRADDPRSSAAADAARAIQFNPRFPVIAVTAIRIFLGCWCYSPGANFCRLRSRETSGVFRVLPVHSRRPHSRRRTVNQADSARSPDTGAIFHYLVRQPLRDKFNPNSVKRQRCICAQPRRSPDRWGSRTSQQFRSSTFTDPCAPPLSRKGRANRCKVMLVLDHLRQFDSDFAGDYRDVARLLICTHGASCPIFGCKISIQPKRAQAVRRKILPKFQLCRQTQNFRLAVDPKQGVPRQQNQPIRHYEASLYLIASTDPRTYKRAPARCIYRIAIPQWKPEIRKWSIRQEPGDILTSPVRPSARYCQPSVIDSVPLQAARLAAHRRR